MEYPAGAVPLLLINLIVHLAVSLPMVQVGAHIVQAGLMAIVGQGIAYLSYPVIGWVTDVFLTRHAVLKCSLILLTTMAGVSLLLWSTIEVCFLTPQHFDIYPIIIGLLVVGSIIVMAIVFIKGLFDANALQFGLDQFLEGTTQQLIAFIHWYYWTHEIGQLLIFYIVAVGGLMSLSDFENDWHYHGIRSSIAVGLIFSFISFISSVVTLISFLYSKNHFYIQRAGFNPLKMVYKVFKYAWKHTCPERRSALTYWEEDIPPRIDLGKDKYGGPFTTEEVEDTKTFIRILPLLLCLFGYHLAGDGYSAPQQLLRTSCPSLPIFLLIVINPTHLSTLVILVGVPVYRFILRNGCYQWCPVRMLRRMWFGLLLSLIQVIIYIVIGSVTPVHTSFPHLTNYTIEGNCYFLLIDNQSCDPITCLQNDPYLWFIIPQLLNGLSSLLVSMTVFEFICAQAPRTTQGLLIGLWYATFSIRYLVVYVIDPFIIERKSWMIYEGVKGFLILVSLLLFSSVSRHYRYRQRDEIVNVQGMIEEIYERRIEQEEEYMQQCRVFYHSYGTVRSI